MRHDHAHYSSDACNPILSSALMQQRWRVHSFVCAASHMTQLPRMAPSKMRMHLPSICGRKWSSAGVAGDPQKLVPRSALPPPKRGQQLMRAGSVQSVPGSTERQRRGTDLNALWRRNDAGMSSGDRLYYRWDMAVGRALRLAIDFLVSLNSIWSHLVAMITPSSDLLGPGSLYAHCRECACMPARYCRA